MTTWPKILVAAPTSDIKDYCYNDWKDSIKSLTYPNLDYLIVDNSPGTGYQNKISKDFLCFHIEPNPMKSNRIIVYECQNKIRDYVISKNFDFLMFIESDIFAPSNVIEHLLSFKKHVIGCMYFVGQSFQSKPMIFEVQDFGYFRLSKPQNLFKSFDFCDGTIKEAYQIGFGCILISSWIIKKIPFRIDFNDPAKSHADTYFHDDLRTKGVKCYLDTSTICEHRNLDWHKVYQKLKQ